MKPSTRLAVINSILAITIFGAILYTSCSKNSCQAVTCQYGATCSGGICSPCPNGIGGVDCEIQYRLLYANSYKGVAGYDSVQYVNNTLTFTSGNDSNYTQMNMVWTNPGLPTVSFALTLTNNAATGSNFTLGTTKVGIHAYSGTGSVNATVASATITQIDTGSNPQPVVFYLNNFNKQ